MNVLAELSDASAGLCNKTTGLRLYTSILTDEVYILLIGIKVIILVSNDRVLFGAIVTFKI